MAHAADLIIISVEVTAETYEKKGENQCTGSASLLALE
jgi:hypothetical protein